MRRTIKQHLSKPTVGPSVLRGLALVLSISGLAEAQGPGSVDYTRAYDLGAAGHVDDLGLIEGARHLVIQHGGEIRIIEVTATGFALRSRITNPLSGDWGHMLTVVPDVDGDGVNEIATYGSTP